MIRPHSRRLHPNIQLIAWFNFLLDLRFYAPILILYFAQVTGSFALGMSLFSVTMLSAAVLEIPTGVLSDRLGRKQTLVVGAVSALLAVLFYAIGAGYWALALGALLEGLSRALFSGNNDALLHDSLLEHGNEHEFAEYSGKTESLSQVAIAVVSILGGIIAFYSFTLVMYLSLLPALAGVFVALLIREPNIDTQKNEGNIYLHLGQALRLFWANKKLRLLSLSSMIGYSQSEAGYQFRSAFFATLWPVWAIGIAKALGSVGAAASFWFAGALIKRFGEFVVVLMSKGYSIVTNIISTIMPGVWSPLIMSSNSLFFGSASTASSALKQKEYSQHQRATMASLDSLGGSAMYGLVAILLGLVADAWSPATGILALQSLAFVSMLITWYLYRTDKQA
ncbi:hypothetical protein A2368_02295 [Candidatus Collierbacteria bacterium RIFOXYB1_FULL_49_13]|uniref:Major facilitator superfamily (MFS) profile domain-containing protein n=1 Tax=Candidatus Collierbacteria bacterium RIFOXYB1_FULL_49_13 TaxID=1817728 RepID=A0A1F5FIV8_9BACT|nr:MAG: hypothetical protein A2368_02295 [Candidatus Collierbacteria bacterium RIFOXYB1_FULL_49_13]